jgi:trehalose 6-phosphate phosphatase
LIVHALSAEGRAAVQDAARAGALLAFDFDGTLAPIVERPGDARVRDPTRALLRAAAHLFRCAVVSGRGRGDVASRLDGIPLAAIVGDHGADRGLASPAPAVRAQVRAWASALRDALEEGGVEVEEKAFTLAVHYRRAHAPEEARRRILHLATSLPGARVFGGLAVVNLAPVGAPTKGDAVAAFAAQFSPAPLLYLGDDDTDEDAFRSRVVTCPIRVGYLERTAARYYLRDQGEVDAFLWTLVSERARAAGLGDGWQELDPLRDVGGAG